MIHSAELVSPRDLDYIGIFPNMHIVTFFGEKIKEACQKHVLALRAESASFVSETELKLCAKPAMCVKDRDDAFVH